MSKRIGAVITALLIIFPSAWFPAQAGNEEIPEYVYNFDDLQDRLDEYGEATLGDTITIPQDKRLRLDGASVHTGGYGIIVKGVLELGSCGVIIGDGVSQPVVEVFSGGNLFIGYSIYENAPSITATGDSGRALLLREGSWYGQSYSAFMRIAASGTDGVALESEIALDISRHLIEAQNGTGIICHQDVKLYLCQIAAGTSPLIAPDFTADTCAIFPATSSNGTVINRKITSLSPNREYIALGDPLPDFNHTPTWTTITLSAEGYDDVFEDIYITPDVSNVDTSVVGLVPVTIAIEDRLLPFDLLPEEGSLFGIEICDVSIPSFTGIGSFWGMFYYAAFWYRADDASGLTLWRSDDEGVNWYDHTEDADINFYDGILELCFSEITEQPIWFVWEVEGLGESQILRLSWDGIELRGAGGGDRTGGDHGANTLPPITMPGITPPPSDEPETTPEDSAQITPPPPTTTPSDEAETTPPPTTPEYVEPTAPPMPTPTPPFITSPADPGDEVITTPTPTPTPASTPVPTPTSIPAPTPESNIANPPPINTPQSTANKTPQPAQATPTPTPPPVKPTEYSDEKSVTISGARLDVMIAANPAYVTFVCGELRISLPTAFLKNLADINTFTVTLYQPGERSFIVSFTANQKELARRFEEPFMISLPWISGAISCVSENDESADAALDGKQATFLLYEAGVYTLTEQTVPAVAIPSATPPVIDTAPTTTDPSPAAASPAPQNDEIAKTQEPHKDSVAPIIIVGSVGFFAAGAYLWFSRIRGAK